MNATKLTFETHLLKIFKNLILAAFSYLLYNPLISISNLINKLNKHDFIISNQIKKLKKKKEWIFEKLIIKLKKKLSNFLIYEFPTNFTPQIPG